MTPRELKAKITNYYALEKELKGLQDVNPRDVESCAIVILNQNASKNCDYVLSPDIMTSVIEELIVQYKANLADDKKLFERLGLEV